MTEERRMTGEHRAFLKRGDFDIDMKFAVFQSCDFYKIHLLLQEKWKFIQENIGNSLRDSRIVKHFL